MNRRAVGVGGDESRPSPRRSLDLDGPHMISIHFRNEERHIRFHAMRGSIGEHSVTFASQPLLDLSSDFARQCRKRNRTGDRIAIILDHQSSGVCWHECIQSPVGRLPIGSPNRSLGCHHLGHSEPRVMFEQLDKSLSHTPRCPQHCHRNSLVVTHSALSLSRFFVHPRPRSVP